MDAKSWNLFAAAVMAVMTVWPASVKADDDDNTTATFIAECSDVSANRNYCQESIGMGVAMGLSGGPCVPRSLDVPSDAQILQVIDWLKAHPDVRPDDWSQAVDAALAALYTCAN